MTWLPAKCRWMGAKPGDQVMLERRLHDGNDAEVTALPLPERFVVPFLQGTLTEQEFVRNLKRLQVCHSPPPASCNCKEAGSGPLHASHPSIHLL